MTELVCLHLLSMCTILFPFMLYQVDKLAFKEQMVSILVKLGHLKEGEKIYRSLLFMNSDNYK